jgi:AmmeMemoRadiSam system protein A
MKKYQDLLKLARLAIESNFDAKLNVDDKIKKKYSTKKACFVTLTIDGELRGCIGSLYSRQELWKDVIENAENAAFFDPRFNPLSRRELDKIKIEISILSIPKKLEFSNLEGLKKKIKEKGVILKKGIYSATYLPQVWEDLTGTEDFLSSLCQKAGLSSNSWKDNGVNFWVYDVEKIEEK